MKLRIIIFIFSAIVSLSGYAQTYTFNHLGIEDGMSQNQVNGITKDQFGFMWFGTWDGLNRFDGYNFKVFKHRAFDTTSLSSNFISCLLTDSKGRIWIGTNGGGLNLFLPKSETFKIFYFDPIKENSLSNNSINIMLEDSQNRIWIATEFGLNLINQNDTSSEFSINQFFFQNPLTNESANEIKSIVEISKGEFLLGTNRGLINLHIQDGSKFSYNFLALHPLNQNTFEDMHIQSLYMDSLDRIWIGLREGLYLAGKLEKKGDIKLKQIKLESNMALDSKPHEINFINQDIEGKLWVGTQTGGLFICNDLEIQNFVQIRDDNSTKLQNHQLSYSSFYQSPDEKILWIGTEMDGIKKLTPTGRNFENIISTFGNNETLPNPAVFAVYQDRFKNTWIGTKKGLSVLGADELNFYNYQSGSKTFHQFANDKIRAFEEDSNGNLWMGTINGLCKIKWTKNLPDRIDRLAVDYFTKSKTPECGLKSFQIYDIHQSSNGKLWVATDQGLYLYIESKGLFKEIEYLPMDYYDKNAFIIKSIYENKTGELWLSTNAGLHRITEKESHYVYSHFFHNPLDRNSICSNDVNHITQDSSGAYWIATAHGLNKMEYLDNKAEFTYFGSEQGIPNEYLYSVFTDRNNILWMSSNMGIIRFDIKESKFKNFVKEDGIQSNEFNIGAFFQNTSGKIFLGGLGGLTLFTPENIVENTHLPKVYITSVIQYGKEIFSFMDINSGNTKNLDYQTNNFTVEFVALDFTNPSKNQYAYKLEGLNKDWIQLGNERSVTFTQLNPGNYILKIKGSNNNGIWNSKCTDLYFTISPPIWQRAEFYIVTLFMLGLLVYFIYKKRLNDKIKYLMKIEKIKGEMNETIRKNAAADFHDEMGHYLTRINVLTEILKQRLKDRTSEIQGVVSSIGEQSQKLYNGTRDFIWTINPDNNNLYELAIRLKDFGDDLTLDMNINFAISGLKEDLKELSLHTDQARHLVLIFKEAINNSVKHSKARNIELVFNDLTSSNLPIISLSDDGIGIKESSNDYGSGMQNMRKRATRINSQLVISQNISGGTLIRLIPKDYLEQKSKLA